MKKKILICLERLDIGGVETSVINQATEYKRRGYDIVVMAQQGIYSNLLKSIGVECIDYEFTLEDKFFLEKENYIKKIIEEHKITEAHIHQYPCILHVLPILLKNKIPYIAFVHSIIEGTYEWFMETYNIYNFAFPLYFQNAMRIVTIREKEFDYNAKLFDIKDKKKYFLLKNSIDFNQLPENNDFPNKINNYLLISRISKEKLLSIENGIKFFLKINNKKKRLTVLGDGKELEYLRKKYTDERIEFFGKSNKVLEIMKDYDAIIGVDRCILEAICCKKIAIISSYKGILDIVNEKNIEHLSKENFSGKNLVKSSNIMKEITTISKQEYQEIVEINYKYAHEKFNIKNNILDENFEMSTPDYNSIYNHTNNLIKRLNTIKEEKNKLATEIINIKNSRRWKLTSFIIRGIKKSQNLKEVNNIWITIKSQDKKLKK